MTGAGNVPGTPWRRMARERSQRLKSAAAFAPGLGVDETVAHQAAIYRRAPGDRVDAVVVKAVAYGAGPPAGMGPAQLDDGGLDLAVPSGAGRTGLETLGEAGQAAGRVAAQPAAVRPRRCAGPLRSRWPRRGLPSPPCIAVPPTPTPQARPASFGPWARTTTAKKVATGEWWTLPGRGASCRYRSQCRQVPEPRPRSVRQVPDPRCPLCTGPHKLSPPQSCGISVPTRPTPDERPSEEGR